jgi:acyl-CoA reductase-like NAD-dependent aldehyde dehydrogenase
VATLAPAELVSIDPARLREVGRVSTTPSALVPELVAESRLAQERWSSSSWDDRRALVRSLSRVLLARADELARVVTAEVGKPLPESYLHEAFPALDTLAWLVDEAEAALAPEVVPPRVPFLLHKRITLVREPRGVVAVIAPWNFPFAIPFVQAITAVTAGNAVVVKPSELTPLTGALVEDVFREAGAPPGLVRVAQGAADLGEALVRARGIAQVLFTGSVDVGRRVAALAAERLCPVTLELGGKHPMLVLEDADLGRAVSGAVWGAFANCGQACVGVERIYVARTLHDEFLDRLATRARALRIGPGDARGVELGPLVSQAQRDRLERLLAETSGEVVTGGRRAEVGLPGWFHEPTVVAARDNDDPLCTREAFGPVVAVLAVDSEDEAVRLANDSQLALGASVWTRSTERARRVASRLHAGMVWTNDIGYTWGVAGASWGGRKDSGYGVTRSRHALLDVTHLKLVDDDPGRVPVPWWYPYGPHAAAGMRALLGATYGRGLVPRTRAAVSGWRGVVELARRYAQRP